MTVPWLQQSMPDTENSYRWATVESLGPLTIRLDGDTDSLAITPDSLVSEDDLIVGARVWCQLYGHHIVVLGSSYHPPAPVIPSIDPEISGTVAADDYYEKYPNGMLICRGYNVFPANAETNQGYVWTFPVAFVGEKPFISVIGESTVPYTFATCALDIGLTSVEIRFYRTTSSNTTTWFQASGRWK